MPCNIHTYAHEGGENDEPVDSLGGHDGVLSMMKLPLLRCSSKCERSSALSSVSTLVAWATI